MKIVFVIVAVAVLAGCGPSSEVTNYPMPPELSDCSQYRLSNGVGSGIVVVRCPNSTTSTTHPVGKSKSTTVVIDGVEYVPRR